MRRIIFTAIALSSFTSAAESSCKIIKAETDLNGLRLGDSASVERLLGDPQKLPRLPNDDSQTLVIYNRDRSETATLTAFPGDFVGDYRAIEVEAAHGEPANNSRTFDVDHLSTERGIRLGVTEQFVTDLLGPCFARQKSKDGTVTLRYDIRDQNHPFLKRAKVDDYSATYRFRSGRLSSFEFGSEAP